jgi:DNA topoisomerase-1
VYIGISGRRIRSERELARIRAIVIPPAWTDVWICPRPDGHIQAIGRDARGRRQYRYHAGFRARRDRGKFARLVRFAELLPRIRRRVREDLRRPGLPREKVLAAVVTLLEMTRLRVGNPQYARLNRSFGLSTLRDRHARVTGTTVRFRFRGKGGRTEERELVDRRLAGLIRRCQDLPGQDLFQYVDDEGSAKAIRSEDVNDYLRDAAGSDDVSAKDFRTWTATVLAFKALHQVAAEDQAAEDQAAEAKAAEAKAAKPRAARGKAADSSSAVGGPRPGKRRNPIVEALRRTAEELGDTVAVTRSAYVHPGVIDAFDGEGPPRGGGRAGARDLDGPIDRRTELEVLALLRRADRATRAARRSQVGGAAVAGRARGRRA